MTPREVIRRVRRLEIRTRRLVQESLAGSYHSVFRGRGMEFSEVREYVPGDDVRTIDWNVSARMGHPFVKKFTEERELTVVLVVDVSGSEHFGTGSSTKMQVLAEISALLAFSAIMNNDRVGLLLFTDRVEQFLPPRKGREHGLRVLREVLAGHPEGRGTRIGRALEYLQRVVRKRAVVFLLSDFQDDDYERTLRVVAQKHDLVAIALDDPREATLPSVGLVSVVDPETGEPGLLDTSSRGVRRVYEEYAERRRVVLRDTIRRSGVDLLELSTDQNYELPLVRFFHERARRAQASGG
ncbi:MAG: DUF58 domain-containing protein [Planctomycetes bacterium]|nr:DUF58 domain-containing protein [Planctomycetota bacterium]